MRHCHRLCFLFLFLLISASAYAETWNQVAKPGQYWQVLERDGKTYALSDHGLYVSTDDLNWTLLRTVAPAESITSIVALSADELFLFGYNLYYHTIDGGQTWKKVTQSGFSTRLCISDSRGYLYIGSADGILRSTDKGASWNPSMTGTTSDFFDIGCLVAADNGDVYAGNQGITGGSVYRSTDGGESWNLLYQKQMEDVTNISVSGQSIFISYLYDLIYSDDYGANWQSSLAKTPMVLTSILFNNDTEGYLGTSSLGVLHTQDYGLTWENATVTGIAGKWVSALYKNSRGDIFAGTDSGLFIRRNLARVVPSLPGFGDLVMVPNPATPESNVSLYVPTAERCHVAIYNESGVLELSMDAFPSEGAIQFSTSSLSRGTHFVTLGDRNSSITRRLLIQ